MSQEKVNQYKESKKNRKESVKKDKQKAMLTKVCIGVILLVLIGWIGYSAVMTVKNSEGPSVVVNTTAIDEYVSTVQ